MQRRGGAEDRVALRHWHLRLSISGARTSPAVPWRRRKTRLPPGRRSSAVARRRRAVDFLDQHPARRLASGARAIDQHARDRAAARDRSGSASGRNVSELPIAARQIRGQRAVDEDHRRADAARRPAAGRRSATVRAAAGCSQNESPSLVRALRLACDRSPRRATSASRRTGSRDRSPRARRPRPRRAHRAAIAAGRARRAARTASRRARRRSSRAGRGRFLHRLQHRIDAAEAAGDRFGGDRFARDDAVAREQLLRDGGGPRRGRASAALAASAAVGCSRRDRSRHQRPSAFGRRRRQAPRSERRDAGATPRVAAPRRARARERAQRVKRVVGDQPLPDQVPQRVDRFAGIAAADRLVQRPEERRAVRRGGIRGSLSRVDRGPPEGGTPSRRASSVLPECPASAGPSAAAAA